jgi:hypothetical protein
LLFSQSRKRANTPCFPRKNEQKNFFDEKTKKKTPCFPVKTNKTACFFNLPIRNESYLRQPFSKVAFENTPCFLKKRKKTPCFPVFSFLGCSFYIFFKGILGKL